MSAHLSVVFACLSLGLVGAACATTPDTENGDPGGESADITAASVGVCRRGSSLPVLQVDGSTQWVKYGQYDGVAGLELTSDDVPFNGWEHAYWVTVIDGDSTIDVDPAFVEACAGKLRVLPNAKLVLYSEHTPRTWCKPRTEVDGTCLLADNAKILGAGYFLRQLVGPIVTSASTELRSGPGASDASLETLPQGTALTLLGDGAEQYTAVTHGDKKGWVDAHATYGFNGTAVTKIDLRQRKDPSVSSENVQTIAAGTTLTLSFATGRYVSVEFNGKAGYVLLDLLKDFVQTP